MVLSVFSPAAEANLLKRLFFMRIFVPLLSIPKKRAVSVKIRIIQAVALEVLFSTPSPSGNLKTVASRMA